MKTFYNVLRTLPLLLFLGILVATPSAEGQVASSMLTMVVKDATTQEVLPFAHVVVGEGGGKQYHTDKEGVLRMPIPIGGAVATVNYIGYEPQKVTLRATKGERLEVLLQPTAQLLEGVDVVSQRSIAQQTNNVVQVDTKALATGQSLSLASVLQSLSGLRVLSTGAVIEKPIIEGMSGSRIAIVDNQTKLVGQHWGDDHAPEISMPSYARVEVLKGAESVKYGANAIGGVVMVNTDLDPAEKQTRYSLHSSYSTNGKMYGGDGFLERSPLQGQMLRYRLGYKYYRSGDYHTAHYLLYNTGSKLHNMRGDVAYRSGRWNLNTHLALYDAEMGIFTGSHIGTLEDLLERFKVGQPNDDFTAPFSYKIGEPRQHVMHLTASQGASYQASERDLLKLKYAYQLDYRREYDLRKGDYLGVPSFAFKLQSHQLDGAWHRYLHKGGSWENGFGLLYARNVTDTDTKAVPIIPNYVSLDMGLYSIWSEQLSSADLLEMGLRADAKLTNSKGFDWVGKAYGGSRHFGSLSGSLGWKHRFSKELSSRLNVGLAWRAPEMNELYSNGVHHGEAVFQEGDVELHTEKALKLTWGLQGLHGRFSLDANLFGHYIHDFIYNSPRYTTGEGGEPVPIVKMLLTGAFPVYFYQQANGLFGGGDLTLGYGFTKQLHYEVRGEWMWAKNLTTGGYFPNIPPHRYSQRLEFSHDMGNLHLVRAELNHTYVTKQTRFDPRQDLLPDSPPAYHLLGGEVSYTHPFRRLHVQYYVRGENLLNQLYKDYTNRLRFFAHDKGRNITVGIRIY